MVSRTIFISVISSSVLRRRHSGPFSRDRFTRIRCIFTDVSSKSVRFMSTILYDFSASYSEINPGNFVPPGHSANKLPHSTHEKDPRTFVLRSRVDCLNLRQLRLLLRLLRPLRSRLGQTLQPRYERLREREDQAQRQTCRVA